MVLSYLVKAFTYNPNADNRPGEAFNPIDAQIAFSLIIALITVFIMDMKNDVSWNTFFKENSAFIGLFAPLTVVMLIVVYSHDRINQNYKKYYNQIVEFLRVYLLMFLGFASTHDALFKSIITAPYIMALIAGLMIMVWLGPFEDAEQSWFSKTFGRMYNTGKGYASYRVGQRF